MKIELEINDKEFSEIRKGIEQSDYDTLSDYLISLVKKDLSKNNLNNMLPLKEYAEKIGKTPDTVRQKILRGNLPAIKIGNQWMIKENQKYQNKQYA